MAQELSAVLLGLVYGLSHAFEADHLTSITTLAADSKSALKSVLLGVSWALGHTASITAVSILIFTAGILIPDIFYKYFEILAAFVLILLGINILLAIRKNRLHLHYHKHGKAKHIHFHSHKFSENHSHGHQLGKSAIIGAVYGLAGSAALTVIFASMLNSFLLIILYIILFGLGTVIGMSIVSGAISFSFNHLEKLGNFGMYSKAIAGTASVIFGLSIIIKILI